MVTVANREPADKGILERACVEKKQYAKPLLATHGSVQQLTLAAHSQCNQPTHDCGSNLRFKPGPLGGGCFGD